MKENSFKKWQEEMDEKREVEKIVLEAEKSVIDAQKRVKKMIGQTEEWAARKILDLLFAESSFWPRSSKMRHGS